ncbi:hypothetical protein H4W79_001407 [Nocardiopsis terrae]|uniref:CDP-Glycerol:Poly(Glycerophosphate) glycerophosphotransferase n=1 Tax=Nocardiopsis terrae TaxID=372655 RepID=A0ABR9HDS6_9ACTN|nr:hypothetical protein [Nocardiopsis terrae]MBE1457193.1 hypothetical protein [Nocardiopsis terrae]
MLAVAHTVADAQRLMDPVAVLAADQRVQVVFTIAPHAVFGSGVDEWLRATGTVVVSWEQAIRTRFDLALATSMSRELDRVLAPIVLFAHGVGFNKLTPFPEYGRQRVARQPYGLAREGLVRDGQLVVARLALAHTRERTRLGRVCPEAMDSACVVGDAAVDRLLESLRQRDRCRRRLGVGPEEKLVVATSTWGASSLLGEGREILSRLVRQARGGRCRVALLIHPNVWAAHGTWQVVSWLRPWAESGLIVVPMSAEWSGVLAAADAVLGDHGSTALYATLLTRPILLAPHGAEDVDPASPMGQALRNLPRIGEDTPILDQLLRDLSPGEQDALTFLSRQVSSYPGRFAPRVRAVLYELLDLSEPDEPAGVRPLRPPALDTPWRQS